MDRSWRKRLPFEIVVRIIADALMLDTALLIALTIRYVWLIEIEGDRSSQTTLHSYMQGYLGSVGLLTLLSLVVFYFSGFYTHGRRYRGRYKALVIAQAV